MSFSKIAESSSGSEIKYTKKPFECDCNLQLEIVKVDDQEEITCTCPNTKRGCSWKGQLIHYLKDHCKRCNFKKVNCYCNCVMLKGHLRNHLLKECRHRKVDYSIPDEVQFVDCPAENVKCPLSEGCKWIGTKARYEEVHVYQCHFQVVVCICEKLIQKIFLAEHLADDCPMKLHSHPDMTFAENKNTINEPVDITEPATSVVKTVKSEEVQCEDGQLLRRTKELEKENTRLKGLLELCIHCLSE